MFSNDSISFDVPSEDRGEQHHDFPTVPPTYVGRCPDDVTNCGRILRWDEILVVALDLPAYFFHTSMLVFIAVQVFKGDAYFSSAFYRFYCVLGIAEILHATQVDINIGLCQCNILELRFPSTSVLWRRPHFLGDFGRHASSSIPDVGLLHLLSVFCARDYFCEPVHGIRLSTSLRTGGPVLVAKDSATVA